MGLTQISGLPAHVLLVHAVVVLVPITVLLLMATVLWRGAHPRLGIATPLVALLTLLFVPLTTSAGEWLRARVPDTPLVARHAEMGDGLLPWVAGLFIVASVVWFVRWRTDRMPIESSRGGWGSTDAALTRNATATRIVLAVLAVAVSLGALVTVVRVGDSGARAAWQGNFSQAPTSHAEDG